ncbi:hypothetical protein WDU94_007426 [Cyamophila willieti]
MVLLDIEKAFDCVWHEGIIHKLDKLNVNPIISKIILSYLKNQTFQVKYNGKLSTRRCIAAGVPQGSILGPVLFCVYLHDLPKTPGVRSALYADDTAIYVLGGPHAGLRLQHQLDKLEPYYRKWKIKINAEKTERYNGAHKTKVPTLYNSTYKVMGKLPSEPAEPAPDFLRIQQSLIQEARQLVAQPEEEEELSEP